jgi:hypothetical protein
LLADDNRYLQDQLRRISGEEIIGADFGLKGVMDLVRDVAPLDSPVIVLGETATSKELKTVPFIIPPVGGSLLLPLTGVQFPICALTGALTQQRGRYCKVAQGDNIPGRNRGSFGGSSSQLVQSTIGKGKRFRQDVFFRLNAFPTTVPPSRERSGDIPARVQYFIMKKSQEMGLIVTPTLALAAMLPLKA